MIKLIDIIILKIYYDRINVNNIPRLLLIPKSDNIRLLLFICDAHKEDNGYSYDDCFMDFSEKGCCRIYYINWRYGSDLYCVGAKHELSLRTCFCKERSTTNYSNYDELLKNMGQRTINKLITSLSNCYNSKGKINKVSTNNYKLLYKYILNSEIAWIRK